MDRGINRSIFKNPPQPFMCIQGGLEGSDDPCFINVMAWEKISQPSHPTHQIPLFGGMKIKNASLNSLAITDLYEGIKNGLQPLIFAVCANTAILKKIGKGTSDEHNRDALIYVILEFIEAMNSGIKFQYKFKVLPDIDVIGELKDIWFIIQSKRDQEKMELNNAEAKRQMLDIQVKDQTNGHWNYRDGDVDRKSSPRKEFRHDGNSGLLQYSPHLSSKEFIHTSLSQNGAKNKHVERRYSRENGQSSAMKEAIDWSKRAYTSSHLAQVNYSLSSSSHNLDNISLKPLPPSFNESLEMKARVGKYAAMNHRNKTETVGPKEDKTLLPPFSDSIDYPEDDVCNRSIAPHKYTPSNECLHHASISAGPSYHVLNSYESELAMCDQLWHGIATEFPSLDRTMQKEDFGDDDDTVSAADENDAFNSNILVKRKLLIENIMDSMTDLSNDAELGGVSDETLDVQESDLVKELTEYGAIKRNQADTKPLTLMEASQKYLDVQEVMDFTSDMARSSHDFLDKTKSVAYRPYKQDLSKIPKSNNNIPSFNELNKNIGLSQSNSRLKSLKTDMENFALKVQKDNNNDNMDA